MPVVRHTLKLPDGVAASQVAVLIELVAATSGEAEGHVGTSYSIINRKHVSVSSLGYWEADLDSNIVGGLGAAEITQPANTYYQVTEDKVVHTIQVPNSTGPLELVNLLITPPAALATAHESDPTAAHAASAISFAATGTLASTDVQAAIAEAASEAYQLSGHTLPAHDTLGLATQAELDDHSARHEAGGADALAIDAAAGTGSLRTLGSGPVQAAPGNHAHPSLTITQQADSYTLALTDAGTRVEGTKATAMTITVPPNSTVAFPIGTVVEIGQYGAGQVTLTPGAGVTLRSPGAKLKLAAQYSSASLVKRATDEWIVAGDLTA